MALLASRVRPALPPRRRGPAGLRVAGAGIVAGGQRFEPPRATQPEPFGLPSPARGPQEISLCSPKFSAVNLSGLGARSETSAGSAGGNSRPYGSGEVPD